MSKEPRAFAASTQPAPLRVGTSADFARVRSFLHDVSFDDRHVTAALKIQNISQLPEANPAVLDPSTVPPALLTAINLFVCGHAVPAESLRRICDEATYAAFAALDLIREGLQEGSVVSPIWLYPVDGLLIASDRQTQAEGIALPSKDAVFPAHDAGTLGLLRLLPSGAGGDALDLCSGSGVVGLCLARTGMRSATVDITDRSAHFAAFNAHLNGVAVESLCGDLYAPVGDRRLDLITAHPPWVPSTGDAMVFRDGGDTGEEILARVVAGVPHHLRIGGTAIIVSLGRDGRDARFQQRLRRWLGDAGGDCDIILGTDNLISIDEMFGSMARLHLKGDVHKAQHMARRFRELGTEKFVHGAAFIRRTGTQVTDPPLRLRMAAAATAADFDRIFAWRRLRRSAGFSDWLAATAPRLPPDAELTIRHVVRDGTMVADSAMLNVSSGALTAVVQPDVFAAQMIAQFDGRQTVAQTFEATRRANRMPDGFTLEAFLDLIDKITERGLLVIDAPVDAG